MGFYITPEAGEAVKAYQYHGADLSFYYRFLLTPMNKFLVELLPLWLAPNVVTITGLVLLVIGFILSNIASPTLTEPLPLSLNIFVALALFIYQTLDNLDGRQARRTGNSSPLGLLCDHGCDAIAVTISSITLGSVFRVGASWYLFGLWLIAVIPFSFATWEEYYTGSLVLGVFNGPSDGILVTMCLALIPVFFGADFWILPIGGTLLEGTWFASAVSLPRHCLVLAAGFLMVIPTICFNFVNVFRKRRKLGKGMGAPLKALGPFFLLIANSVIWLKYASTPLLEEYPRLSLLALGFVFGNMACKLMLAHICGHHYKLRRFSLIPLIFASINSYRGSLVDDFAVLLTVLSFAFACWLHFVVFVSWELSELLNIRVFFVKHTSDKKLH